MILNTSIKRLTLLLAVGVTCATGSNLRQRRAALFQHHITDNENKTPPVADKKQLIRSPSASAASPASPSAEEEAPTAVEDNAALEPSIALDKSTYVEEESITATFSVGPPSHPYYSSSDAPSLNLDYNYPQWSVGLFMRDADPQGGTLSPIVSINVCGAMGDDCDADDRYYAKYNELTVTFGNEHLQLMQGQWPLENSAYGTGFDAYILDGNGAAAIGPLEFSIKGEEDVIDEDAKGAVYRPSVKAEVRSMPEPPPLAKSNPLLKYRKGIKKATERQHADVSKAQPASQATIKIVKANGLEMSSNAVPSDGSIHKGAKSGDATGAQSTIVSDKGEYEDDECVSISFSLEASMGSDVSGYRIGIFMRMAHPQGGALPPIVSLPLCSEDGCDAASGLTAGSVTFSQETMEKMTPAPQWPIDLYQWGTGFDAYVLDENGAELVGPVKFNIRMNDTY